MKVRAPSGARLSLHETPLCATTLFAHASHSSSDPAGPALCRHVQLRLKGGGPCALLRHGEHIQLRATLSQTSAVTFFIPASIICCEQLLEAQADYHRRSLAALEAAIPIIQMQQGEPQTHLSCLRSFYIPSGRRIAIPRPEND